MRGTAHQVYEKYVGLARDAQSSGDRILAESFLQHAEHYFRIFNDSMDPERDDARRLNGHGASRGEQPASSESGESQEADEAPRQQPDEHALRRRGRRRDHDGGQIDENDGVETQGSESQQTETSAAPAPASDNAERPLPRRRGRPRKRREEDAAEDSGPESVPS